MNLPVLIGFLVLIVRVGRSGVDAELDPLDPLLLTTLEVHVKVAEIKLRQLPLERRRLDPQVAQRPNGHIAADA